MGAGNVCDSGSPGACIYYPDQRRSQYSRPLHSRFYSPQYSGCRCTGSDHHIPAGDPQTALQSRAEHHARQTVRWSNTMSVVEEVVEAVRNMSHSKTGALIVFARSSSLQDLVDVGVKLDARVNSELLETIFRKDTPLHDGAVVIRNNRIVAASCYLPISQNPNISSVFGTRHRAAVGVSETNNVFVIVVSEETGRISIARNGNLTSGLSIQKLRAEMEALFGSGKIDEEEVGFSSSKTDLEMN